MHSSTLKLANIVGYILKTQIREEKDPVHDLEK
jgi:hypothetical protein